MSKGKIISDLLGCVVVLALVMVGLTGLADAAAVKVTPAEFTADGGSNGPGGYYKLFAAGTLTGTAAYPCLVAAVKISGSATKITKLTVYLKDTGAGAFDPRFYLTGANMTTGSTTSYVFNYLVTTGTPTLQGIEIPLAVKNITKGEKFALGLCLDAGQTFYGAKVNYQ